MRVAGVVKSAVIASLYAAFVILLAPISFLEFQVRVADALLLLPFLDYFGVYGVVGLTVGCAIGNIASPFGVVDVVFGSLANLVASLVAWAIGRASKKLPALITAALAESIVVSLIVGYFILHLFGGVEFLVAFIGVLVGSLVAIGVLGTSLVVFLMKGLKIR